jgi:hypothetical protein
LDYDETEVADKATMKWVESKVNAKQSTEHNNYEYSTLIGPATSVKLKNGDPRLACAVQLGTELSMGKVIAIVQKKSKYVCQLPTGEWVTPGLLLWDSKLSQWFRAGERYATHFDSVGWTYYSFIVSPTANIELASGVVVRDYFEVHSPDTEQFYEKAITGSPCILAE